MRNYVMTVTTAGLMAANLVLADCTEPVDVELPDGATATTEQMVAGQQQVKQYVADAEAFLACLEQEERTVGDEVTDEQKLAYAQRYNSIVDRMESLASGFNEAVRAYKAANPQ